MVARQSAPMKINHACRLHTTFYAKYTSRRQGRESSRSESLSDWSTDAAEIEIAVRQFRGEVSCKNYIKIPGRWTQIGTVCVQSYSIYSPSFLHNMDVFWPNGMLTWLLAMQYWYNFLTNATMCLTRLLRYRDDYLSNTWDPQTLLQITTAVFIKNYDRQLLQVTTARVITTK